MTTPACRALRLSTPPPTAADWLTEGESALRQQAKEVVVVLPLQEAWVYNAEAGFGPGSPLWYDDAILVGTRKGEVHAIDATTGKRKGLERFGDVVEGTPAIDGETLFVPAAWSRRALYAYDLRRGQSRWQAPGAPIEAGLLIHEGLVYAADVEASVHAYDAQTGDERWVYTPETTSTVSAAPVAVADVVFVADRAGRLTAFDAPSGAVRWQTELDGPVYLTPAADARNLYVPTTRGRFVTLDAATGGERWRYSVPDTTVRFTSPALGETHLYVGGTDGLVRALRLSDGALAWTFEAGAALSAAPLATADAVFVGTLGQTLHALDPATGEERWQTTLRGRIKSAMAARNGHLVVLSEPRYVYLFTTSTDDEYASIP